MKEIKLEDIKQYQKSFKASGLSVNQRAVVNNGLAFVARNNEIIKNNPNIFEIKVDAGEVHNQKHSGRCWLFAAQAVLEPIIARKLKVEKIKLSKAYTYFYDKLEMANSYYEHLIETKDLPLDNKKVQEILRRAQEEGGFWHEAAALIDKYGVVPEEIMPENPNTEDSTVLNEILDEKLRSDAVEIRAAKNPVETKEKKLNEIYQILCISLGTPPMEFSYEFTPKDNKKDDDKKDKKDSKKEELFKKTEVKKITITPLEFLQKYGESVKDFCDLDFIRDYKKQEWNKLYSEEFSDYSYGNLYTSAPVKLTDEIKDAMIKQLKNGEPVWFWWDVAKNFSRKFGVLDADLLNYQETVGLEWKIDYLDRGLYHDSLDKLHATVITGVHCENGKPVRWQVKNSWGSENLGNGGYIVMNDNYLEKCVDGVSLRKKYLPKNIQEIFNQEPTLINYYE